MPRHGLENSKQSAAESYRNSQYFMSSVILDSLASDKIASVRVGPCSPCQIAHAMH